MSPAADRHRGAFPGLFSKTTGHVRLILDHSSSWPWKLTRLSRNRSNFIPLLFWMRYSTLSQRGYSLDIDRQYRHVILGGIDTVQTATDNETTAGEIENHLRRTLRIAKEEYRLKEESRPVEEAERTPYTWLHRSRPQRTSCPVSSQALLQHFKTILSSVDSTPK